LFIIEEIYLNKTKMRYLFYIVPFLIVSCISQKVTDTEIIELSTNTAGRGSRLVMEFLKGPAHNHPSMAIWAEDMEGNYIETLYVTRYVGTGTYEHGEISPGNWSNKPGPARRPATLPYWAHKRGIQAPDGLYIPSADNPLPDALTSATPKGNFRLQTALSDLTSGKFRILLEINQPWDSNKFWTNDKFPGDLNYFGSLQPSVIYAATIDVSAAGEPVFLNPIGHGHPSGSNGQLITDLTTLTTAKEIIHSVNIRLK
jgi:hypothetical protein